MVHRQNYPDVNVRGPPKADPPLAESRDSGSSVGADLSCLRPGEPVEAIGQIVPTRTGWSRGNTVAELPKSSEEITSPLSAFFISFRNLSQYN